MFRSDFSLQKVDQKALLSSPTMYEASMRYVMEAYETNCMSTVGENVDEAGCKYEVAFLVGVAALLLSMKLAGEQVYGKSKIGKGVRFDRYVAAGDTAFDAAVNPIVYEGGVPVFIDTEYEIHEIWTRRRRRKHLILPGNEGCCHCSSLWHAG